MEKKMGKKVETSLEQILAFCQEKAERTKEYNNELWKIINNFANMIEEEGIEASDNKLKKAKEDYSRAYSQLFGMLELAQAIYDPEDEEGYFTVTNNDHWQIDKVVFKRFEDEQ